MGILLVRHSDAVEGGGPIDDASRWLSATGRRRAYAAATLLAGKGLVLDRFVTSPRVRAVQTAEIYAHVLGYRGAIEGVPELSFTAPAADAARVLRTLAGNVAAFGHMPTIAEIVQLLSNGRKARPLLTSEAVWIEGEEVAFRLEPEE
jgi:phosphohistidine phosphatase SixA